MKSSAASGDAASEDASEPADSAEPAEVAALASDHDMGEAELAALAATFGYLVRKKKASTAKLEMSSSSIQ